MSLYKVGRLCMKIAGRDAGKPCVVVENVDSQFVVIDGSTRRRKVNVLHLEPLAEIISISDKASHEDVKKEFGKLGFTVWDKKSKKPAQRPKKAKVKREKKAVEKKDSKIVEKKEAKMEEKPKTEKKSVEDLVEPKTESPVEAKEE